MSEYNTNEEWTQITKNQNRNRNKKNYTKKTNIVVMEFNNTYSKTNFKNDTKSELPILSFDENNLTEIILNKITDISLQHYLFNKIIKPMNKPFIICKKFLEQCVYSDDIFDYQIEFITILNNNYPSQLISIFINIKLNDDLDKSEIKSYQKLFINIFVPEFIDYLKQNNLSTFLFNYKKNTTNENIINYINKITL